MKNPRRKKLPKISTLWKKASTALQEHYRRVGGPCLACGKRMEVMHHHFHWGRSLPLRFNQMNLVPLCQKCHLAHHCGNHKTSVLYQNEMREMYGSDWEDQLLQIEQNWVKKTGADTREWLQEVIRLYQAGLAED